MVTGEKRLSALLSGMEPVVSDGEFVFMTVDPEERPRLKSLPVCEFREEEGLTLIIPKREAEELGLKYEFPCRMITLTIHSSLAAVGFLAAITTALAQAEISVNAVSAFYHDHLFVPSDRLEEVLKVLRELSQ